MIFNPVVVKQGGGGGAVPASTNDVNFYDYEGTLLYSYSVDEVQKMSALPKLPSHDGLVCQGWNWTLDDLKATNRAMNVGAMYITDDGKTRLYIRIAAEGRMTVPLYISQTVANGVTIDWGDGSVIETLAGTGNVNTTHTYASVGDYVITLDPVDGCTLGLGGGGRSYCVMGSTGDSDAVYCNMLRRVEIGRNVTSIGSYSLQFCYSLSSIVIPDSVTSIESYAFQSCYSLSSIVIPDSVTSIESYAFQSCYSLASINIPDSVTSIGTYAFHGCYGMAVYDFSRHTAVPTLDNTNAFTGIPSDCEIRVPAALEEEWKSATNWASYADYIVGVYSPEVEAATVKYNEILAAAAFSTNADWNNLTPISLTREEVIGIMASTPGEVPYTPPKEFTNFCLSICNMAGGENLDPSHCLNICYNSCILPMFTAAGNQPLYGSSDYISGTRTAYLQFITPMRGTMYWYPSCADMAKLIAIEAEL